MQLDSIRKRLKALEPRPVRLEPWPPTTPGDICTIAFERLRAEGVEFPIERPSNVIDLLFNEMARIVWKK